MPNEKIAEPFDRRSSASPIKSVVIISNQAFSMINFRGPLIKAIVARGVKVYALAPDFDGQTRAKLHELGGMPVDMSLERAGLSPVRDAFDLVQLVRILRRLAPDATFAYFIKPVIYGSLAARIVGVPHRFSLVAGLGYAFADSDGSGSVRRMAIRWIATLLYKLAFASCEKVFFQNDDDIQECSAEGMLRPGIAVRVNGTGVDLQSIAAAPSVTSPVTFLLMARLLREKGIVEYVDAARSIKAKYPKVRFLLLGGLDPNPSGLSEAEVSAWVVKASSSGPDRLTTSALGLLSAVSMSCPLTIAKAFHAAYRRPWLRPAL